MKMRFLPTAPIHIVWYIRKNWLLKRLVNVFLFEIWSPFVFHLFVSKAIYTQISINLLEYSRFTCRFLVSYINMVLILRTWRVKKSLPENYCFNVSTDFVVVLKTHFGELKMGFLPTDPIHIVWYVLNFFMIRGNKVCFYLNYDLHSCTSYVFQKLSPPKLHELGRM
jgi:hypothetical protein